MKAKSFFHLFLIGFAATILIVAVASLNSQFEPFVAKAAGSVIINPTAVNVTEGGTTSYVVSLDSAPASDVIITFSTDNAQIDPIAQITFTPTGDLSQTVTVSAKDDAIAQGPRDVQITHTASGDSNYAGIFIDSVTVHITDNDTAGITLSRTSGLVTSEALTSDTFTIKLNSQPTANVTIGLSSSDATEGTVDPTSVTFTSGDWSSAKTVTVTGVDDPVVDGDVFYTIVTAAANSADSNYNNLNAADVSVKNTDNDAAGITVNPTSGLVTTEAAGPIHTATFTIVLASQPNGNVNIGLSSNDTSEGDVSPSSVHFTPATWDSPQTVTVTGADDFIDDGDQPYTIITANPTGGDATYNSIDPADVSVTNTDDDTVGIHLSRNAGLVTTEAGGTDTFTIVLNSQPTANVSIGMSSLDPSEGLVSPNPVVFTPENWNLAQTVTATGVNDSLDDGDVAYTIQTVAAVSSDPLYDTKNPSDVTATNTDNDTAGITVDPTTGLVTNEAGGTATFTVVLNSQPTADVIIGLSSTDTTEGTVYPTSVTFTPGNWNNPQTVTVTGIDDFYADGNIFYQILTAPAVSGDSIYNSMNPADVSVTNNDNDIPGITVNPTSLVTTEAAGPGHTATFTIVLNTEPTDSVTINLSSNKFLEGTVSPAFVTFTTLNWGTAQTVTVTGVDDNPPVVDGNIAYTIVTAPAVSTDPVYNGLDAADVSATNNDNDYAHVTVTPTSGLVTTEASGTGHTATFTVVLTSHPTANVTIGLTSSDLSEGTVNPTTVTFTTAPGDWSTLKTVTVTGVDDLLDDGDIGYTIQTSATSTDTNYSNLSVDDVTVTNQDNDATPTNISLTGNLSLQEGEPVSSTLGTLSTTDADLPNDSFTYSLVDVPPGTYPDNAAFQITAVAGQPALTNKIVFDYETKSSYNIKIRTTDSRGLFYDKPFTINVINTIPVALSDSYTLRLGKTLNDTLVVTPTQGILANDTDKASATPLTTLKAVLETPPLHAQAGGFTLNADGSFTYKPEAGYTGTDEFSYRAYDGNLYSAAVKVEINVLDANSPFVKFTCPVEDNKRYDFYKGSVVHLCAYAEDNIAVSYVEFQRWDPVKKKYVKYKVESAPYELDVSVGDLYPEWNQVYAVAYDNVGNRSNLPSIWIYSHWNTYYMPLIFDTYKKK